jgi:hypothetical protein
MWGKLAELYGWNIPAADLERFTPALDSLSERARKALDRDLSTVEPAPVFRPGGGEGGAGGGEEGPLG